MSDIISNIKYEEKILLNCVSNMYQCSYQTQNLQNSRMFNAKMRTKFWEQAKELIQDLMNYLEINEIEFVFEIKKDKQTLIPILKKVEDIMRIKGLIYEIEKIKNRIAEIDELWIMKEEESKQFSNNCLVRIDAKGRML